MEYWHHISQVVHPTTELYHCVLRNRIPHELTAALIPKHKENEFGEKVWIEKYLLTFEISESDPHWQEICQLLLIEPALNMEYTTSSEEEQRKADWCWVAFVDEGGFPQPEEGLGYKHVSLNVFCPKCNIYKQIAPFRIKKEIKIGRNSFHRLFWINEIFAKPEVMESFTSQGFKGFDRLEVLLHKTNQRASSLEQLYIQNVMPTFATNLNQLTSIPCPECGRVRYEYQRRGSFNFFYSDLADITEDFMVMKHWTGNGGATWRETIFSKRVVNFVLDKKMKGIRFLPINLVA